MSKEQKDKAASTPVAEFTVVRATRIGFAHGQLIPVGRTFSVTADQFSPRWMVKAPAGTRDELAELLARTGQAQADAKRGAIAVPGSREAALAGNPAAADVI